MTVLREWGRIGVIGFGGPPAHIALLRELTVERRGWLRGRVEDGAVWHDVIRPLGKDWELVASFSPGIAAWGIEGSGAQDISKVWIRTTGSPHQSAGDSGIAFSVLDPVVASEILRDLTEVTAQATDSR